jgi:hypothetical protein
MLSIHGTSRFELERLPECTGLINMLHVLGLLSSLFVLTGFAFGGGESRRYAESYVSGWLDESWHFHAFSTLPLPYIHILSI